jgi:hypothetical protein
VAESRRTGLDFGRASRVGLDRSSQRDAAARLASSLLLPTSTNGATVKKRSQMGRSVGSAKVLRLLSLHQSGAPLLGKVLVCGFDPLLSGFVLSRWLSAVKTAIRDRFVSAGIQVQTPGRSLRIVTGTPFA